MRPPGVVDEFAIGAASEHLRITILKVAIEFAECGDLGGANEGEILGPEEVDLPLIFEILIADRLKGLSLFQAYSRLQGIGRELVSDA
jgi:hypothetical protein